MLKDTIQREILHLGASFDLSPHTNRLELVVRAAGADKDEARQALSWMQRCLAETDLSAENLPRLGVYALQDCNGKWLVRIHSLNHYEIDFLLVVFRGEGSISLWI